MPTVEDILSSIPERDTSRSPGDFDLRVNNQSLKLIRKAAHRPAGTFHLTLGVMNLSKQEDMEKAVNLLNELDYPSFLEQAQGYNTAKAPGQEPDRRGEPQAETGPDDIGSQAVPPLSISLQSLSVFPNPRKARVFYAQAMDSTNRLDAFAQSIRERFREAGLITETRPLVLHATVANMSYVKGKQRPQPRSNGSKSVQGSAAGGGRNQKDVTVDATEILQFFGDNGVGKENIKAQQTPPITHTSTTSQDEPHIANPNSPRSEPRTEPIPPKGSNLDLNARPFTWATDIPISRIRICEMGAEPSDDPRLGLVYKAVAEVIF